MTTTFYLSLNLYKQPIHKMKIISNDPIFLLCSERSGSNLIRAMLDAHSQIYAPMPIHLGLRFWHNIHHYGDLSKNENWNLLLKHTIIYLNNTLGQLSMQISEEELQTEIEKRDFKNIYLYLFTKGMKQAGKSRVFIKDNHSYQQLYYFLYYFPNAKFIWQVRDPRDYVLSCKKLVHYGNILKAIEIWQTEQQAALEAFHILPKDKFFLLRYEDLVTDPKRVLTKLCVFLSLPFEEQMLNFYDKTEAKEAAKRSVYWQNLDKPLMENNFGKFDKGLNYFELILVESLLGNLMLRLSYKLTKRPSSQTTGLMNLLKESKIAAFLSFFFWTLSSSHRTEVISHIWKQLFPSKVSALYTVSTDLSKIDKIIKYNY